MTTTSTLRLPTIERPHSSGWNLAELIRPLRARTDAKPRAAVTVTRPPDRDLIAYVFASRFATATQVQRRFPPLLPSLRTAQRHLARLTDLGHLAVASVRSTSPNFPLVYYATGTGIRKALRTEPGDAGESPGVSSGEEGKARGYAANTILHELLLTEFALAVWQTVQARPELTIVETERRYFRHDRQLTFPYQGSKRQVIPDSGFVLRVAKGDGTFGFLLCLAELDNDTMSLPRMREKFRAYDLWAKSDEGQAYLRTLYLRHGAADPRPLFRLLVIAHDKNGTVGDDHRLYDLFVQALELPPSLWDRTWFTTVAALRAHQANSQPMDAEVWLRGRDAQPWITEYQAINASLPRGRGHHPYERLRAFVAMKLSGMERHGLFPPPQDRQCSAKPD